MKRFLIVFGLLILNACHSNSGTEFVNSPSTGQEIAVIPQDGLVEADPVPTLPQDHPTSPIELSSTSVPVVLEGDPLPRVAERVVDITMPLPIIFSGQTNEYVDADGFSYTSDSLGGIKPGNGTIRFSVKKNPFMTEQNFLEIRFSMVYPRNWFIQNRNQLLTFFPTDWVDFHLRGCASNGLCFELTDVFPLPGTAHCDRIEETCELQFYAKVPGARLPMGGVEKYSYYKVQAKRNGQGDFRDQDVDFKTCSPQSNQCSLIKSTMFQRYFPYCVSGVCSAVRDTECYGIFTPSEVLALN